MHTAVKKYMPELKMPPLSINYDKPTLKKCTYVIYVYLLVGFRENGFVNWIKAAHL